MIQRIRRSMEQRDRGFGLIELLVVIIIIGVLAAVAIPVFLNQKKKAVDTGVISDMRSAAANAKGVLASNAGNASATTNIYTASAMTTAGFKKTNGNDIAIAGTPVTGLCIRGFNPTGTANSASNALWWDSLKGGLLSRTPSAQPASGSGGACASGVAGTGSALWQTLN